MKSSHEPTCPACGGTPASMIEDGYSTDLVPWWRHYVQKFNPFRPIRRKTEFEWQPIETAPMDGSWVLVVGAEGKPYSACYNTKEDTFYDETEDKFFSGGWTDYGDSGPPWHNKNLYNPTHWCPLPPLP